MLLNSVAKSHDVSSALVFSVTPSLSLTKPPGSSRRHGGHLGADVVTHGGPTLSGQLVEALPLGQGFQATHTAQNLHLQYYCNMEALPLGQRFQATHTTQNLHLQYYCNMKNFDSILITVGQSSDKT